MGSSSVRHEEKPAELQTVVVVALYLELAKEPEKGRLEALSLALPHTCADEETDTNIILLLGPFVSTAVDLMMTTQLRCDQFQDRASRKVSLSAVRQARC